MAQSYEVLLREVYDTDLTAFYEQLQDHEAVSMATAYTEDPSDRQAFNAYWSKLRRDQDSFARTIALKSDPDGGVVGHIVALHDDSQMQVRYWIDRAVWGKGIATSAVQQFLKEYTHRPLFAYAPKQNIPAQRVLLNNGFITIGENSGFDSGRGRMVNDVVLRTI